MWDSRDRRDLAYLGLMVLVYGLAVAPVLHAVVGHGGGLGGHAHAQGPGSHVHRTGSEAAVPCGSARAVSAKQSPCVAETGRNGRAGHAPDGADGSGQDEDTRHGHGHRHLSGSVEHLLAVAASWTVFVAPALRWVSWSVDQEQGPEWSPGQRLRATAMPQGP